MLLVSQTDCRLPFKCCIPLLNLNCSPLQLHLSHWERFKLHCLETLWHLNRMIQGRTVNPVICGYLKCSVCRNNAVVYFLQYSDSLSCLILYNCINIYLLQDVPAVWGASFYHRADWPPPEATEDGHYPNRGPSCPGHLGPPGPTTWTQVDP